MAELEGDIRQSSDPGQDIDHLFLCRAFNVFQARAQSKTLTTFAARASGGAAVSITLAGVGGVWANPVTGAFGGAVMEDPRQSGALYEVATRLTDWLRRQPDARAATFRLPPDCFPDPAKAPLENALFRNGWRLDQVELDQYLPVTSAESFVAGLGETKQKELRRLLRSGAAFRTRDLSQAQPVYDVIARNRAARGYPMTMTWPQVHALGEAFPEQVRFFAIERGADVLAGAVLMQVTRTYAYVFYWGEDPAFRREGPVVMLAEGLMRTAHENGSTTLDIGISTEASQLNSGLFAFKATLGCRTAAKRSYCLDLTIDR